MANETAYIAAKAVRTPPYEGPTIDVGTPEELAAELYLRGRQAGAAEQQVTDERAISALASLRAESLQHQQRIDRLSRDLAAISQLHAAAADVAAEARNDAGQALAAARAVPAVDVAAVARLSAEVLENGTRATNMSAQAQQQIAELTEATVAQVGELQAEVEQLTGNATSVVEGIQQISAAAVAQAQEEVATLLAGVPDDIAAAARARLDQIEVLVGGEVNPANAFEWLWQWARLGDLETVSRTTVMPILPGWEGQPGRSAAPIGGGGGGGGDGTGSLYLQADLQPSVEARLQIRSRTNLSLPGRDFAGPATIKFSIGELNAPDNWVVGTLDVGAALNAPGAGQFTVAAELLGPGVAPEFTFRVEQTSSGTTSAVALWVTCNVSAQFNASFIEIRA